MTCNIDWGIGRKTLADNRNGYIMWYMPTFTSFMFVLIVGLSALSFLLVAVVDGFLTEWNPVTHYTRVFKDSLRSEKVKPTKPLTVREKMEAEGKW